MILAQLKRTAKIRFSELVENFKERSHGVMTFLAGLELTRRRVLFLRQARPFTELWIYRREDVDEAESSGWSDVDDELAAEPEGPEGEDA